MFQQDFVLRQIEMFTTMLAKLLGKDSPEYEHREESEQAQADLLYAKLLHLVEEGQLNEAEDLLFEELDASDTRYLEVAVAFYAKLNTLSNAFLESHDFSRSEIEEGLRDAAARYGVTLE